MRDKERYEYRKHNHLCATCGKNLPDEYTYITCDECREYNRLLYSMRKKNNVCAKCGKEDAYTMNGRARCAECAEKQREGSQRYRETSYGSQKNKERWKQIYKRRKEDGNCISCGRKLPRYEKHARCAICRTFLKRYRADTISHTEAHNFGLCAWCIKRPATHGRLCDSCFPKSISNLEKARAAIDLENHIWRAQEAQRIREVRKRYGWEEKRAGQE